MKTANRPNVHDEPFLRRRVFDVRRGRDPVSGQRPGGPGGPDDLHIPQDDQMHFLQVRRVRRGGDARFHLHTAAERRQREDLRLPVVLVLDPRRFVRRRGRLQVYIFLRSFPSRRQNENRNQLITANVYFSAHGGR